METSRWRVGVYPGGEPQWATSWAQACALLRAQLEAMEDPGAWGMRMLIPEVADSFAEHIIDPFLFAYITPFDSAGNVVRR